MVESRGGGSMEIGRQRQAEIFLRGVAGRRPAVPVDVEHLEAAAREAMTPQAFAYVAGGAGSEHTVRANRAAFDRWRIVPRVLRDVSRRDLSVSLFGQRLPCPLLLAPIGVLEMAHPEADLAVARAAAKERLPTSIGRARAGARVTPVDHVAAEARGDGVLGFRMGFWCEVLEEFPLGRGAKRRHREPRYWRRARFRRRSRAGGASGTLRAGAHS